jgi:hypothetical protein
MQSKTHEEVLVSIKEWIHRYPLTDTFKVGVLTHPIVDMNKIKSIGEEKINKILKKLLEEKYREAFPDFNIEENAGQNFVFYLRVTFHSV